MKGPDNKDFWIIDKETAEIVRFFVCLSAASGTWPIAASTTRGKAKNPKCHSPHIMDADLLMQTIAEVLKKIEDYYLG